MKLNSIFFSTLQKSLCAVTIVVEILLLLYIASSSRYMSDKDKAPVAMRTKLLIHERKSDNLYVNHSSLDLWNPYTDFMSEEEVLMFPSGSNLTHTMPSPELSTAVTQRMEFTVGDMIPVMIEINDINGIRRSYGGDCVRIRITEPKLGAYAAGYVIDHKNGSYTAVMKALWQGNPTIVVQVAHTREEIQSMYDIRKKVFSLRQMIGVFSNKSKYAEVLCFPSLMPLNISSEICNISYYNDGMPLFCQKPTTGQLECNDFVKLTYTVNGELHRIRNPIVLKQTISVRVTAKKTETISGVTNKPPCSRCNTRTLWTQASPVGYYYNNTWISTHCKAPPVDTYDRCLNGKYLVLFGDSTTRMWLVDIIERFHCSLLTKDFDKKIHYVKDVMCKNHNTNFTMESVVHAFPSFEARNYTNSISKYMLRFTYRQNVIFLIHIYLHFTWHHHSLFRDRLERIVPSIKRILRENPNAKFLVKGCHTHWDVGLNDYYCYLYRTIMIEVFEEVLDSVIYLDFKDMTIARGQPSTDFHPPSDMVSQMVNHMLSFLC